MGEMQISYRKLETSTLYVALVYNFHIVSELKEL